MNFAHPILLWLLAVVPPGLAALFWWNERVKRKLLGQFVEPRLLAQLTVGISPARRKFRCALVLLAAALLIFTLAQPRHGFDLQEVEQNGLDVVVVIDTSKSMLTTDIAPNRLERAKLATLELMQKAGTDRLGLVAFAGDAFLECPLTTDNTAFQQSVQALDVNAIPEGGTDLGDAISTALTAFKETGQHHAIVLFTDGEDNVSETNALEAAGEAAKVGVKIFTVGVGTAAGDLIRITDANGNADFVRDDQGNVVKSHLNEPLLQRIASLTGGFYLPLRGANTIDTLYSHGLDLLPKSEEKSQLIRRYHEQFQWWLAAAMLLLLAEIFLPERRRQKKAAGAGTKTAAGSVAALVLAGCLLPHAARGSPASALQAYASGNYTNALQEYQRLAQIDTNDLRLVFNAGTAAYRATNYDEALKDFQAVAASPDLELQQPAFYNIGNTLYRMGEQQFEPDSDSLTNLETTWQEAAKCYAHAVELNTNDVDAAYNRNFVERQLTLIAQLREAMRRAKLEADDAVRHNAYHQALEIMLSLRNPIASKKFEDYIKKLKDIDAIVTPNQSVQH